MNRPPRTPASRRAPRPATSLLGRLVLVLGTLCGCSESRSDDPEGTGGLGGGSGTGGSAGTSGGTGGGNYPFEPFAGTAEDPDPLTDRLCDEAADPEGAADKVNIHCRLEGGNFAPPSPAPVERLSVLAWNMERGVHLDEQIVALRDDTRLPRADLLLVSELDRGCSRSGGRNTPRELARALGWNYVFAVEFVELPREGGSGGAITDTCEHGNAIFSRYPLGNVQALRHTTNKSWYLPPDQRASGEPRLGGRVLVVADVRVGERIVHAYSLHFESNPADNAFTHAQAVETAEHGAARPFTVVQGGDTNAPVYWLDLRNGPVERTGDRVVQAFFDRGFVDAHAPLSFAERGTRGGLVIDLMFGRPGTLSAPGVCPAALCDALSDHRAVFATLAP